MTNKQIQARAKFDMGMRFIRNGNKCLREAKELLGNEEEYDKMNVDYLMEEFEIKFAQLRH